MEADIELAALTSLLDLDEFEVVESTWDRPAKLRRLTLVPKSHVALCPHCDHPTDLRHVCHDRVIADLPMGQQRVELVVRLTEIANYFVSRSSNGRTEGYNRGLRGILWRTCGMTNFSHFRLRVLHLFG